jgi:hypothetical protein
MKKNFYYVDFSTWIIEAENEEECYEKVLKMLEEGKYPPSCSIQDTEGDETEENVELFRDI